MELELRARARVRADLLSWCRHVLEPLGQEPAEHHRLIIAEMEKIVTGETDRLMVLCPPGSAKSTYISDLFVPYYLARKPQSSIVAASHTTAFSRRWGRRIRNRIAEHASRLGYGLSQDDQAADHWSTTNGSEYGSYGVGAAVTGRRGDLIILDDLVSGREAADSLVQRDAVWDWYRNDLYTRLKPGGAIVLIMTRWHMDDIGGRLLAEMDAGTGDTWKVLRLPALAEHDDPMGREPGEPLWPAWEDSAALARKRRAVGERAWLALYQQRPSADEGSIILREWWKPWTEPVPSAPDFIVVSLDTAYTEDDANDPTACTIWYVTADPGTFRSQILLRYAWAKRLAFPELLAEITDTIEHFGKKLVPMKVLIEAKASGLSVVQELRRRKPDLLIQSITPKMDKVARAHAVTALFAGGHVHAMAKIEGGRAVFRPASEIVIAECAQFPLGMHDDLTDSCTMALSYIRNTGIELFAEDEPESVRVREQEALY